jgi:hypothetical protein
MTDHRHARRPFAGLALAAALAFAAGCQEVSITTLPAERVEISPEEAYVVRDATVRLTATAYGSDERVLHNRTAVWTSLDPEVASVDGEGNVRGLATGKARIRASVDGASAVGEVHVLRPARFAVSPTSVTFDAVRFGPRPADRTLSITNTGDGTLTSITVSIRYAAGQPTGWLSHTQVGTTAPTSVVLRAEHSGLAAGSYRATVELASPVADNSPRAVDVVLNVTEAPQPPAVPVDLEATAVSDEQIDLRWEHQTPPAADRFEIQRARGNGSFSTIHIIPSGSVRSYSDTGLSEETTYRYRIRACNAAGCSAWSETATATTFDDDDDFDQLPGTPTNVTAVGLTTSSIAVTWTPPGGQTRFEIRRRTGTGGQWTFSATVSGTTTTYLNTGLNSGTTYQYQVRACNNVGCSSYSSTATASTL